MPEVRFKTRNTNFVRPLKDIFGSLTKRCLEHQVEDIQYPAKFFLTAKIDLSLQLIGQTRVVFIGFNAPQGWKLMSVGFLK